jgi:hypothetical protein
MPDVANLESGYVVEILIKYLYSMLMIDGSRFGVQEADLTDSKV